MFSRTLVSSLIIATLSACSSSSSDDPAANPFADVSADAVTNEVVSSEVNDPVASDDDVQDQVQVQESNNLFVADIEPQDQVQIPIPTAGPCIDADNDGYGWNGVASCSVVSENTEPNNSEETTVDPTQDMESVAIPFIDRYETYTLATWPGILSADAMWPPGGPVVEATSGWTRTLNTFYSHLVLCENPDITMEDPSNPGLFYDAAKGQTCAKSNTVVIPATDALVQFADLGLEVFYENGNQWRCTSESRPDMNTEFESFGDQRTITYDSGQDDPRAQGFVDGENFPVHYSYKDDVLIRYTSGLQRTTCNRIVQENFPFTIYGEEKAEGYNKLWNAFIGDNTLDKLSADQLIGRSMRCSLLYQTSGNDRQLGQRLRWEELEYDITVEALGGDEYSFSGYPTRVSGTPSNWTQSAEGEFIGVWDDLSFYGYSDDLSLLASNWSTPGASSSYGNDIYACETLSGD